MEMEQREYSDTVLDQHVEIEIGPIGKEVADE